MAHTQKDKRKASTSLRGQNTDGHVMKCKCEGEEATEHELISMVELARFQKDEGPKEPWRPGYKGGAGRCVCEVVKAGGLGQAVWGGAGPADLLRHPCGLLLLMKEFSQMGSTRSSSHDIPEPSSVLEVDNQQHSSSVYSEKKKTEKYKQKENV